MPTFESADASALATLMIVPEIRQVILENPDPIMLAHVLKSYAFRQVATITGPGHCAMLAILEVVSWDHLARNLLDDHQWSRSAEVAAG